MEFNEDQNTDGTPVQDPPKDYVDRVHATLKESIDGFDKTPEDFRKLMTSDADYRSKVYKTLKENIDGFDKTPEIFDDSVGIKKKEGGPSGSSNTQTAPAASTASGSGAKTPDEFYNKAGIKPDSQILDETHATRVQKSIGLLNSLVSNPNVVEPLAKIMATKDATDHIKSQFESRPGVDNTGMTGARQQMELQVDKGGYLPIKSEDIDAYKHAIQTDPVVQRKAMLRLANTNKDPNVKKSITQSIYDVDANSRATDPEKKKQILENSDKIASGEYKYVPNSDPSQPGQLLKPEDLGQSLTRSSEDRDSNIDLFNLADEGDDHKVIQYLNNDLAHKSNPDNAKPVPNAVGEFVGGNWKVIGEAGVANVIPVVGTALSGGVFAHEMARTGYANELKRSYAYYKNENYSDHDALLKAKATASKSMLVDAVVGGAMGLVGAGGKAAEAVTKEAVEKEVVNEASKKVIKSAWQYVKDKGGEAIGELPKQLKIGAGLGTVAAGGEIVKNIAADQKDRSAFEGAGDAFVNMGALHLLTHTATALASNGLKGSKILYDKVLGIIKKVPIEDVKAVVKEQVDNGITTEEGGQTTIDDLENHIAKDALIPEHVKNPEIRSKIQNLIGRRDELQGKLETLHKTFHAGIKEKMQLVDEQIEKLSSSPEAKQAPEENIGEPPETGNPDNGAEPDKAAPTPTEAKPSSDATIKTDIPADRTIPSEPGKPDTEISQQEKEHQQLETDRKKEVDRAAIRSERLPEIKEAEISTKKPSDRKKIREASQGVKDKYKVLKALIKCI